MTDHLRPLHAEIVEALTVLLEPGQVVELRVLHVRMGTSSYTETRSGYFDTNHLEDLTRETEGITSASGFYCTLNPVCPDLYARAYNRCKKAEKGAATGDHEILKRRWLLVDLDVNRPAGISSTDAEKAASKVVAKQVRDWLTSQSWPDPVVIDSGNGFHLLYRVDLPAEDSGLVQRCLEALHKRFSDTGVKIDTSVFNASRITKLPGTPVRKGDSTPDRPHRMSKLVKVPETLEVVPTALLETLAGPDEAPGTKSLLVPGASFDLAGFIGRHFPDARGPRPYLGGNLYEISCPWRSSDGESVHLIQFPNGALDARCQHATCPGSKITGNHWQELRARFEPPSDNSRGVSEDERYKPLPLIHFLMTGAQLACLKIPHREMIVAPFLATASLNMVVAPRGLGKTFFGMEMSRAVTMGQPFFEWPVPVARDVLFLDGEMPTEQLQERFFFLFGGQLPERLTILPSEALWTKSKPLNLNDPESQERVQSMLNTLEVQGRNPALIIMDNLSSLAFGVDENDNSMQDSILRWLMSIRHRGYAVLLVHHTGKNGEQRGASRREDFLDTSIRLSKPDGGVQGNGAAFRIDFTKERGGKAIPNTLTVALEAGVHGEPIWARPKAMLEYMRALVTIFEHHPENITALGKLLDITRQGAQKHVEKLREKGFLHPMKLDLTAKGTKMVAALKQVEEA